MKPEQIKTIADAYIAAPHTPEHPSYRAFVTETLKQYRAMTDTGIWIITAPGDRVAYDSSADMFADLARYRRLIVATDGSPFAPGHPLDRMVRGLEPLSINTAFRAVHDYFGHYLTRNQFETFAGEIAAYQEHARRYSPDALPALFSETVAQLCHYYAYGSFVPVQKAAILPQELMTI